MTLPLSPSTSGPVRDRSVLPDVLRGVALTGILIVNMQDFAGMREWQQHGLDGAVQVLTDTLANGRFISIFAMLFGWGAFGLLASRGVSVFVRRHLTLLLIGALHFILVWHGDIIGNYALLAFALILLRNAPARTLLSIAVASGGYWVFNTITTALSYLSIASEPRVGYLPKLQGGLLENIQARAAEFLPDLIGGTAYNGFWLLALFCLGGAAQRLGVLHRPHQHVPLLRRLATIGTALGLTLGVLLAFINTRPDFFSGLIAIPVRMTGGLAGGLGYVGLFGLLTVQERLGWWWHFAQSGRLAMSNYLAQSVVMTTIFYPYGLAQWGKWGAASTLLLALSFGLLQVWLSGLIIRRFGSGPMEKLVRLIVYGSQTRRQDA